MNSPTDNAIAREVRESYRQLRRTEILQRSYHHHNQDHLINRVLQTRRHKLRHRSAAARLDRALLTLETHLRHTTPGYRTQDFIDACQAILNPDPD
ncbi:MAG: hypothetical protein ACRCYU_07845 [Nocardioides sp.]